MTRLRLLAAAALAAALTGCAVGPDFTPPVVSAPANWGSTSQAASRTVPDEPSLRWWQRFRDPQLVSLVDRLTRQNLDIRIAAERVLQGAAQGDVVASRGLPHLEGQSIDQYRRESKNGLAALTVPAPGAPTEFPFLQQGIQTSWELDLFGRVRRAVEAQDANTLASQENRHAIALAALAELAQSYLQLRGIQARTAVTQRNLRVAQDTIKLVQERLANGYATTLDLAQARSQEATISETLPSLRTQEARLINAIGMLLGEEPRALDSELRPPRALPRVPRLVSVGVPGALVRRRPDVREAEARLHAAVARVGAAEAEFYPDITLIGDYNVQSIRPASLFTLGSRAFDVGPSVTIPIFEGGRLRGNLELRESEQREAAISFQRTVLRAWQEVDDALTAYAEAQKRRAAIARAVEQNDIALKAALQRYGEGLIDFLNVNMTQNQLLQSQNELADSDAQIAIGLVTLYRALGGGWDVVDRPAGAGNAVLQPATAQAEATKAP